MNLHHISTVVLCFSTLVSVKANFDFTVRFYEYWNPTGLCAECGTNGVPVCCDDPLLTETCQNTGVFRCDTRFRYILRPFNASLETAPNTGFPVFTPSLTNLNHETFREGNGGFLGSPNPNNLTNTSTLTGRIQLLVDAFDRINNNQAPNETDGIIDRFLINLDQLKLGADLTEQTTYDGIHNISQLAISFQVECSENYYGSDCTTFCEAVEGVYNCDSNGSIVCVNENRNSSTRCIKCFESYYGSNCTTFCEAKEGVYNCGSDGDIVCVEDTRDPSTRCTQCLTGRNPTTNCTSCLPDYIGDNCVMDPCLSDPCENGATCTPDDTTGEYECRCAMGFEGMDCESEAQPVNVALIGGVVGGVAGVLILIVIILVVVIVCLTLQLRTKHRGELDASENDYTREHVKMNSFNTNTGGSADHFFDNTLYGSGDTEKPATETEYSQLHHNLKAETNQPAKHTMPALPNTVNGTNRSPPKLELAEQPTYDSANHHTGYTSPPVQTSSDHPPSTNYDIAYPVTSPVSQEVQPQPPVYDTADNPPSSSIYSDITDDKKSTLPVYESADNPPGTARPSIYDDTVSSPPLPPTNVYDYATTDKVQAPPEEKRTPRSLPVYESADLPPPSNYSSAYPKQGDTYDDTSQPPVYDTADNPPLYHNKSSLPVYESADSPPKATQTVPSIYDDTISRPPQQAGHTYDYATTQEPQTTTADKKTPGNLPVYDYADTPISVSLPKQQLTYDYADKPVQVLLPPDSDAAVPPVVPWTAPPTHEYSQLESATYTNTMPGEITKESASHYDLGQ